MADEKKTESKKPEPKAAEASPSAGGENGKGDAPRNCFSDKFRSNFEAIDWSK